MLEQVVEVQEYVMYYWKVAAVLNILGVYVLNSDSNNARKEILRNVECMNFLCGAITGQR